MRASRLSVFRFVHAGAFVVGCAFAPAARADTEDVVAAEALFRNGKDLLAQKDYAHACPKLAESYRLDPASGTLLALAICHERQGKLASAWGEYSDVASRSRVEARVDRETAARGRAAELEAEVSTLTIAVPEAALAKGLEIKRNGVVIAPAWFGTPVPIDGGTVSIDASAPGKKARHVEVGLAPRGDRQTVTILPLDDATTVTALGRPPPLSVAAPIAPDRTGALGPSPRAGSALEARNGGLSTLQVASVVAGACGVVALGVGAIFAFHAEDQNNASHGQCTGDLCTPQGSKDRSDAVSSGNVATAAIIGGGVLATAGAALYLLGHRSGESAAEGRASLRVLPTGGARGLGGVLQGTF